MTPQTIALINLPPQEILSLQNVLHQWDAQAKVITIPSLEEAAEYQSFETLILVVFCHNAKGRNPHHVVQRIKRLVKHTVPILLLTPAGQPDSIRKYLRAGIDEYWILPMDSVVFPQRLQIMLELGRSAQEEAPHPESLDRRPAPSIGSNWWKRLRGFLGNLCGRAFSQTRLAPEPSPIFAGRWNRGRRLGFGSFGEVWLVQERESGRLAVAKIPHSAKMNPRFIREGAILRRLAGHPNSVDLLEVIEENGKVILIEEYIEGATLQDLLDQGIESSEKERAFLELLDVLACAHAQKIMHRDIKPENIIISSSGISKLLDFGTGKDLTRKTTSSTVVGSRPYMAPEQIAGKSRLASDVWAMGVLLYAFATGLLPFYDENEKKLMDMILECEPEPPSWLQPETSEELEAIILRCLLKDPELRFRDADELRRELLERFPHFGDGQTLPSV